MSEKTTADKPPISAAALAAARARAQKAREQFKDKPGPDQLLTPQERADAAPFYTELRVFVKQLKTAREAAGLTLAQVAATAGLAEETLSRLETGAATNPSWKTLGTYAAAVGLAPVLTAHPADRG